MQDLRIRGGWAIRRCLKPWNGEVRLISDTVLFDLILKGPETDTQQFGSSFSMVRDFC